MNTPSCWTDAIRAATRLTPGDRRTLSHLTLVPFAWAHVLQQLAGLETDRSIYRSLTRLTTAGLIATLRLPWRNRRSPDLYYLTDLGLAVVAGAQTTSVEQLAKRYRLERSHLRQRLVGLSPLLAQYELLAALAASVPTGMILGTWKYPWRAPVQGSASTASVTASAPGQAFFFRESHDRISAAYMLIADVGVCPLQAYRMAITRLMRMRDVRHADVPTLIIATTGEDGVADWHRFLTGMGRSRHDSPPTMRITTWEQLRAGHSISLTGVPLVQTPPVRPCGSPVPGQREGSDGPMPRLVGPPLDVISPTVSPSDGHAAGLLGFNEHDHAVLFLVGQHPFLTPGEVAAIRNTERAGTRRRTNRLVAHGVMRTLCPIEIGGTAAKRTLLELTHRGVEIVSAHLGLPPWLARRYHGLTGHGTGQPTGQREDLLRNLEHTLGVNDCFVNLYIVSRRLAEAGNDSELLTWQNAAMCGTPGIRPDAYGLYRHHGSPHGFFLEYDRGTMFGCNLVKKFTRYQAYKDWRRHHGHDEFSLVLVVTATQGAEDRVLDVIRTVDATSSGPLAVLTSTVERIKAAPLGMLGHVWHDADSRDLHSWPPSETPNTIPPEEFVRRHQVREAGDAPCR